MHCQFFECYTLHSLYARERRRTHGSTTVQGVPCTMDTHAAHFRAASLHRVRSTPTTEWYPPQHLRGQCGLRMMWCGTQRRHERLLFSPPSFQPPCGLWVELIQEQSFLQRNETIAPGPSPFPVIAQSKGAMFFVEDAKTLAYSFALSQFSSQLCDFRRHGCFAICTI